jgi:hypothetical protein
MAPRMRATNRFRSVSHKILTVVIPIVNKKERIASQIALTNVERRVFIFRVVPPSNKIITKVIVAKTLPKFPNFEGRTSPVIGPRIIPTAKSNMTSGIRVRSNIPVKRCARNTTNPTLATIRAILCNLSPFFFPLDNSLI